LTLPLPIRPLLRRLTCLLLALSAVCPAAADPGPRPPFARWGQEALDVLDRDLWLPRRNLYAENAELESRERRAPAFMWGVGVQLTALAAAARVEPARHLAPLRRYAAAIDAYWLEHAGLHGYDVLPGPKESDRYYDDNAWIALAMIEIHEITGEANHLERALETHRFVMSGEDDLLGGGLYWRAKELTTKNTCTNAPAIVTALRLHQLTKDQRHLDDAHRIHTWTRKHLQDEDGLYLDHLRIDESVDRRKFTYNSALMIRANVLFHDITGEAAHLEEARRIARAAEARWVRADGGIADGGRFAHLLVEAFLELGRADGDARWQRIGERALAFVHANVRDANGRYPSRWDRRTDRPLTRVTLLDQASAARAFWVLAGQPIPPADETPLP